MTSSRSANSAARASVAATGPGTVAPMTSAASSMSLALSGAPGHGRVERGGELAPGDRLAGGSKPLEDWPGGADGAPRLARADRPSVGGVAALVGRRCCRRGGGAGGLEGEQPDHQPDQQVDAGQ